MGEGLIRYSVFAIFLRVGNDDTVLGCHFNWHDLHAGSGATDNTTTPELCKFVCCNLIPRQERVSIGGIYNPIDHDELVSALLDNVPHPLQITRDRQESCNFPHAYPFIDIIERFVIVRLVCLSIADCLPHHRQVLAYWMQARQAVALPLFMSSKQNGETPIVNCQRGDI
jgi:hypothetical protein